MQFISPIAGHGRGRDPITAPTIRASKGTLSFNLPADVVTSMGWVHGDLIEVGYDPARRVFGLRRSVNGFALAQVKGGSRFFRAQVTRRNFQRLSFFGDGGGAATSVKAENGLLLLGDPTTHARLSAAV